MKKYLIAATIFLFSCNSGVVGKDPFNTVVTESNAKQVYEAVLEHPSMPEKAYYWGLVIQHGSIGNVDAETMPWTVLQHGKTVQQLINDQMKLEEEFQQQQLQEQEQQLEAQENNTSLKIGENFINFDNGVKLQVLSFKKVDMINEQNNQFMVSTAGNGNKLYIFDYLVENNTSEPFSMNMMFVKPMLVDGEGFQYSSAVEHTMNLKQGLEHTPVLPNGKARFQIAIEAPDNVKNLKLMPGLINGSERFAYQIQ